MFSILEERKKIESASSSSCVRKIGQKSGGPNILGRLMGHRAIKRSPQKIAQGEMAQWVEVIYSPLVICQRSPLLLLLFLTRTPLFQIPGPRGGWEGVGRQTLGHQKLLEGGLSERGSNGHTKERKEGGPPSCVCMYTYSINRLRAVWLLCYCPHFFLLTLPPFLEGEKSPSGSHNAHQLVKSVWLSFLSSSVVD